MSGTGILGEMFFWPSSLLTPVNLSSGGGHFSLSGLLSWPLPSGLSPAVPASEQVAHTFLSPLLALPGPCWHIWTPLGLAGIPVERVWDLAWG